ncbi:hypothetical protein KGP39_07960 [Weissella hellenica]|nr:hypothetical protein [Weissella hellenica]
MLTVIKQYEDRDVIIYDYYIENRQNVYADVGHIIIKSMGGLATWRAVNDPREDYLKQGLKALFMKRNQSGGVYPAALKVVVAENKK